MQIIDFDFRQGSLIDRISGIKLSGTSSFVKKSKGYTLNSTGGVQALNTKFKLLAGKQTMSMIVWCNKKLTNLNFTAIINGLGINIWPSGSAAYCVINNANGTSNLRGPYANFNSTKPYENYIIFLFDGRQANLTNTFKCYVNNILQSWTLAYGGSYPIGGLPESNGNIVISSKECVNRVQVFDHILLQSEINSDYKDFINSKPIQKAITGFTYPKLTSINEPGLIAAYNMIPVSGKIINIAAPNPANGMNPSRYILSNFIKNSFITNTYLRPGVFTTSNLIAISIGKVYSLCFRINIPNVYPNNVEGGGYSTAMINIVNSGRIDYRLSDGNLNPSCFLKTPNLNRNITLHILRDNLNLKMYIDGVFFANGTLASNADASFGGLTVEFNGTSSMPKLYDKRVYNRQISEQEIKDYHNQFASQIVFKDDFSQYGAGNKPYNWQIKSGTYSVQETFTFKYLKCTSSGVISFPFNARYGTIKAKFLKAADANILDFLLSNKAQGIVAGNTGYLLRFDSDERFKLYSFNGTTLTQDGNSSTLTYGLNDFHKVEIKAYTNNNIEVWINDKQVIKGSSSAYTSVKYLTFDIDTNDSITDLEITEGVVV